MAAFRAQAPAVARHRRRQGQEPYPPLTHCARACLHRAPRQDAYGRSAVRGCIPVALHDALRRYAASQGVSVQLALEQAIRLLLDQPELETPLEAR